METGYELDGLVTLENVSIGMRVHRGRDWHIGKHGWNDDKRRPGVGRYIEMASRKRPRSEDVEPAGKALTLTFLPVIPETEKELALSGSTHWDLGNTFYTELNVGSGQVELGTVQYHMTEAILSFTRCIEKKIQKKNGKRVCVLQSPMSVLWDRNSKVEWYEVLCKRSECWLKKAAVSWGLLRAAGVSIEGENAAIVKDCLRRAKEDASDGIELGEQLKLAGCKLEEVGEQGVDANWMMGNVCYAEKQWAQAYMYYDRSELVSTWKRKRRMAAVCAIQRKKGMSSKGQTFVAVAESESSSIQ